MEWRDRLSEMVELTISVVVQPSGMAGLVQAVMMAPGYWFIPYHSYTKVM